MISIIIRVTKDTKMEAKDAKHSSSEADGGLELYLRMVEVKHKERMAAEPQQVGILVYL